MDNWKLVNQITTTGVVGMDCATKDKKIYFYETNTPDQIKVYDTQTESYSTFDAPTDRRGYQCSLSIVDNTLYMFGGGIWASDLKETTRVFKCNLDDKIWIELPRSPDYCNHRTSVVVDKKILLSPRSKVLDEHPNPINYVTCYDTETGNYSRIQVPSNAAVVGQIFTEHKGKLYFFYPGNVLYIYDLHSESWETKQWPLNANKATVCSADDNIYVVGGSAGSVGNWIYYDTVYIYNPEQDTFSEGPTFPVSCYEAGSVFVNGKLYVNEIHGKKLYSLKIDGGGDPGNEGCCCCCKLISSLVDVMQERADTAQNAADVMQQQADIAKRTAEVVAQVASECES